MSSKGTLIDFNQSHSYCIKSLLTIQYYKIIRHLSYFLCSFLCIVDASWMHEWINQKKQEKQEQEKKKEEERRKGEKKKEEKRKQR